MSEELKVLDALDDSPLHVAIYMYQVTDPQDLTYRVPWKNPRVVSVQHLPDSRWPIIYVEVDINEPGESTFELRRTGHVYNAVRYSHVGSALCGNIVWHVLEPF